MIGIHFSNTTVLEKTGRKNNNYKIKIYLSDT
jgi:hypothetical protein